MPTGSSSPINYTGVQFFYNPNCSTCVEECGGVTYNSSCVFYNGPNLACSLIITGDSVEVALQKIDEQICSAIGDYSTYQFNCLTDWLGEEITTESEFVDAITAYACEFRDEYNTFRNTTYPDYQTDVDDRFDDIENPAITCASASVTSSDTLSQVLQKYCTKFGAIDTSLSLSGITWNSCFTVPSTPLNIKEGFSLLINQICQVKSLATSGVLPTFNNSSNCLSGGVSDSLSTTIGLITTKLCTSAIFDVSDVEWGCLPDTASDLQETVQTIINQTNTLTENFITFDTGDFSVTQTNGGDPCQGITVALATPINQDRLVAANSSDSSPSTLINKLIGVGVTIDDTTNAGKVTLTVSTSVDDKRVKAASSGAAGFLDQKITGGEDNGVTITPNYNSGTDTLDILPEIDLVTLFSNLLDQLDSNPDLKAKFCEKINACPSPCDGPTNVQAVLITTTTTTTVAP